MRPKHWLFTIPLRLRSLFRWAQADQELDDELRDHLDLKTEQYVAQGMTQEEAHRRARLDLGGIEQTKEKCRDTRRVNWIQDLIQDLHYGLRMLRKSPGLSVVAVLTLALGIGANTAIFSFVDAVLLKQVPVKDPQGLMFLGTKGQSGSSTDHSFYFETYERLQLQQPFFTGLAAFSPVQLNVSVDGESEPPVEGQLVSGNYFELLGVGAAIGRTLSSADDTSPRGSPVAMISYDYWQSRFEGSSQIIGRKILIDGSRFVIVGVTPRGFSGLEVGSSPNVIVPLTMQPVVMPDAENWLARPRNTVDWLRIVGRLRSGVPIQQAAAGMRVIYRRTQTQLATEIDPNWTTTWLKEWAEANLVLEAGATGISNLRNQFLKPLSVLTVLVAIVLVIACTNIANVLLARSSVRRQEMAVRIAVGAGRGRLVRQLLVESVLLGLIGGAFGVLQADWGARALIHFLSVGRTPISIDLTPDSRVLGFTALASLVTGVLTGLVPALQSSGVDLSPGLRKGGYSGTSRQVFGKALVVSEVALSLVLVAGGGLFATSLRNLSDFDSGFQRDQVLTVRLAPKGSDQKRTNAIRLLGLYQQMQENLGSIPAVVAVSFAGTSPTEAPQLRTVTTPDGQQFRVSSTQVYPHYFETLGSSILQGRDFSNLDMSPGAPYVAVINDTFARHAFRNENPIGKKIVCSGDQACTVIGVVKDIKYSSLKSNVGAAMYMTFLQAPTGRGQMVLHLRFAGNSESVMMGQVRQQISSIDPNLPAFQIQTLESDVDAALVRERLLALLSVFFGGLAILLAAVGLYGLISHIVARRTREIGVRIALGASRSNILSLVLGETICLEGLGIVLGVPTSLAASRFIESFLYGLRATNPIVMSASVGLLTVVTLLAGFVPAYRAMRVDPMVALRYE